MSEIDARAEAAERSAQNALELAGEWKLKADAAERERDEAILTAQECRTFVKVANDENIALAATQVELVKTLEQAGTCLRFAFNRIEGLPRSRDTELARDIGKVLKQISDLILANTGKKDVNHELFR